MLLFQEFDLEVRDKKGSKNVVANHLSEVVSREGEAYSLPIQESFPEEQFFQVGHLTYHGLQIK